MECLLQSHLVVFLFFIFFKLDYNCSSLSSNCNDKVQKFSQDLESQRINLTSPRSLCGLEPLITGQTNQQIICFPRLGRVCKINEDHFINATEQQ